MGSRPAGIGVGLGALLAGLAAFSQPAAAAETAPAARSETVRLAPDSDVSRHASSVVRDGDAAGLPFLVIDKVGARVFAFAADGAARGDAPILLGLARGDISAEGIGTRRLADIPPSDRVTPAGRFEAWRGRNIEGKDILWLDYKQALSLHSVVKGTPAEQRLKRLTSPSALDNRISYGCINVPAQFYARVIQPLFAPTDGVVYILPETRPMDAMLRTPG